MGTEFLEEILQYKRRLVIEKKEFYHSLRSKVNKFESEHRFKDALTQPGQINLIAEIKKASPSKGVITEDFNVTAIAQAYAQAGAAAISVLTEDKYFLGRPEFIQEVTATVVLPVLAKDFFIDAGQIYEACANGASAILLIAAALDDQLMNDLIETAGQLGLDCVVEIHNATELKRACRAGAEIIGINNRNLTTFQVDMNTCQTLIPKVPQGKVIVAESGFRSFNEIWQIREWGANAVLIGETFMKANDIKQKIKEVMYGES